MNFQKIRFIFFFLFFFKVNALLALDNPLPDPQVIDGMETLWVAENIRYNGVPARIMTFYSSEGPEELIRKYESKWKAKGLADKTMQRMGELFILGIESRGVYYSVQVRPTSNGGSEGSLVVSQSPIKAKPDVTTKFPIPGKSEIMMKVESDDFGQEAEILTIASNRTIISLNNWYLHTMQKDGWSQNDFSATPYGSPNSLFFQKADQICQISFAKADKMFSGKTMITINWMK